MRVHQGKAASFCRISRYAAAQWPSGDLREELQDLWALGDRLWDFRVVLVVRGVVGEDLFLGQNDQGNDISSAP